MGSATLRALVSSALLSLAAQPVVAGISHRHLHQQHRQQNHTHGQEPELVKKGKLVNRAGQCAFPESEGLVAVTPGSSNAGWAMSPDQECTAGSYCPFACPPGQLMNQWKPGTTYVYPESMDGGLYCDEEGSISKPFPSEEYCVDGIGNVNAVNNCGDVVAFCQTVLPGNENMLIPTAVDSTAVLAVPGTSYWDETAAHFYVNPPGYSTDEACAWGTSAKPIGNWSPYVTGANQDSTGNTYVKLGWNPIYTDSFNGVLPTFGLKIECDGDCVGLPCSIDPSTDGFGGVTSEEAASGAGGADFCVVTVTSGSASVVVFNTDGSTGDSSSSSSSSDSTTSAAETTTATSETETPTEKPKTTSAVLVMGLNAKHSTTSSQPPTVSSSSSTIAPSSSTTSAISSTSAAPTTSSYYPSSTAAASSSLHGGVFQEFDGSSNSTRAPTYQSAAASTAGSSTDVTAVVAAAPAATTSQTNDAINPKQNQGAIAGLIVAIVVAACLY